jgi:hypothetical protein
VSAGDRAWVDRRISATWPSDGLREDGRKLDEHTYADGLVACAAFITKEVEEMRQLG